MDKLKKHKIKILCAALAVIIVAYIVTGIICSSALQTEEIEIGVKSGSSITVMHVSDLHYQKNISRIDKIIDVAVSYAPDFIFLTGDIIDMNTPAQEFNGLTEFLKNLKNIAPVFAVFGNHEGENRDINLYKEMLSENDITLLENDYRELTVKDKPCVIIGLSDDINYNSQNIFGGNETYADSVVLMLAHRPENVNTYIANSNSVKPLVTFSGHAHGGQFRLLGMPILSPDQGFFPKYTDGLYTFSGNKHLIVSRGLGNSIFPVRIYNLFHLPMVKIYI